MRDGTLESGLALYFLSFVAFVVALVKCGGSAALQQATLWTMQWILAALRVSWTALFSWGCAALVLGNIPGRILPKESPHQAGVLASVRTTRPALPLPPLLI